MQHVGATLLHAFGHHVAQCCVRLANPAQHVAIDQTKPWLNGYLEYSTILEPRHLELVYELGQYSPQIFIQGKCGVRHSRPSLFWCN